MPRSVDRYDCPAYLARELVSVRGSVFVNYLRNRDVVLSASTLPPVWHVGQYATV